jgi:uncharacterized Zn finger protein
MEYECPECGYREQRTIPIGVLTKDHNAICPDCGRVRLEMQHIVKKMNIKRTNNFKRYFSKKKITKHV